MSGFSHVLYYPNIEILDQGWLKSAVLYWDRISTIVPRSMGTPYQNGDSQALFAEGVLTPLRVDPDTPEVASASDDFVSFIGTPEAAAARLPRATRSGGEHGRRRGRWPVLHPEKLAHELQYSLIAEGQARHRGGRLEMHGDVVDCYMTILAGNLATSRGLALLAGNQLYEPLAGLARRGLSTESQSAETVSRAQALLAQMALSVVGVARETKVHDILDFRRRHTSELGRFRAAIGDLAGVFADSHLTAEGLRQRVSDEYVNRVGPSVDDLRASLKSHSIRTIASALTTGSIMSTPIAIASQLIDAPGPYGAGIALVAGVGISVVSYLVHYRLDRQELLRASPYSYILAGEAAFPDHDAVNPVAPAGL